MNIRFFLNRRRRLWLLWLLLAGVTIACTCNLANLLTSVPTPTLAPGYPTYTYPTYTSQPEAAPPTETQCQPTVTATIDVNVRRGPSKAYDSVDVLTTGESASVIGRSEEKYGDWWVISASTAPNGRGWVWGEAVTANCIPADLQVVVAPPLPQAAATDTVQPPPGGGSWGVTTADLGVTDLYATELPQGWIFAKITNYGPDNVSNIPGNGLYCTVTIHPYSGAAPWEERAGYGEQTLDLTAGQTGAYDIDFHIDTTVNWYEVGCEIVANFNDPNASNNSYSETFPPPP